MYLPIKQPAIPISSRSLSFPIPFDTMTALIPAKRVSVFSLFFLFFLLFSLFPLPGNAKTETLVPLHVQRGTNLIRIARQYCQHPSDWKTIAALNHLKSPYIIYADSTLLIPLPILRTKEISATVISLKGKPQLVDRDKKASPLHKGDAVFPGQTVVTRDDEYVHLIYPDHKHSRIGPESKMLLVYLMRLADDNLQAEFFLEQGRMTNAIERRLKANEHFRTRTPMAITGIRGTEFRIRLEDEQSSVVETLKGKVALSAAGKNVLVRKGQGVRVKKGQPPAQPRPLPPAPPLPELQPVYRTIPIQITVPAQKNRSAFHLRITSDEKGLDTLVDQTVKPGGTFSIASLQDGIYFLFLSAIDRQGFESAPAGPAHLKIRTIPGAPIISSPDNGQKFFEKTVKIRWLKSDDADHYELQLARDREFSDLVDNRSLKESQYITPELAPGRYFFRVRLVAKDGFETLYSTLLDWQIMEQPKLGSLSTSTSGGDDGITLRWPPMANMKSYGIQIATDRDFTDIIAEQEGLAEPSYTIDFLIVSGTYYVRIHSITEDGLVSPWTAPQEMVVESDSSWLPHILSVIGFAAMVLIL